MKSIDQAALRALTAERAKAPILIYSDTSVEEYLEMENAQTLWEMRVPFKLGKAIYFAGTTSTVHIPAIATHLSFKTSSFKSRTRVDFGNLAVGTSVDVLGYEVERDGDGKPINDTIIDEAGVKHEVPRKITKDEAGNDLEPRFLMSFRYQWGTDMSRQRFNRLRNDDMLNLVPNRGVPRKAQVQAEGETKTPYREQIDWALLPNLQPALEKPLLNANLQNNEEFISQFIDWIPIASNAPSRKAEQAAIENQAPVATSVTANMNPDPFAGKPEDTKTQTETTTGETQTEGTTRKRGQKA